VRVCCNTRSLSPSAFRLRSSSSRLACLTDSRSACSSSSASRFSCAIRADTLLSRMACSKSASAASFAIRSASRIARIASRISASSFALASRDLRSRSRFSVSSRRAFCLAHCSSSALRISVFSCLSFSSSLAASSCSRRLDFSSSSFFLVQSSFAFCAILSNSLCLQGEHMPATFSSS